MNNDLINYIYNDKYEKRTISVDGSYLKTIKKLHNDGLKYPSKEYNNYTNSLISGIYDVDKKIIINYNLSINKNERESFIEQLNYIRRGDTLIFDRGYYSENMINVLNNKKVNYVFRIKNSCLISKNLILNNQTFVIYKKENYNYKVVNYTIKNESNESEESENYFLLTNLINLSVEELKNIYWKRWSIETHFKEAKYTTSLGNLNCKTLNNLLKEINIHNYVYILYYSFQYYIKSDIKNDFKNYDFNNKLGFEIFINDILFILIYKRKYKKEILDIIKILPKTYKHNNKNRHFDRISKIKVSKWYFRPEKYKKNTIKNNPKSKIL